MKFGIVILSAYLVTLLTPKQALAENISAAVVVPWSFVQSYAQSKLNSPSQTQPTEFEAPEVGFETSEVPFVIPSIKTSLTKANIQMQANQDVTNWSIDLNQIRIAVSEFSIQQEIQKNIGGANIIVHLSAQCSGFLITQDSAHVSASYKWQATGTGFNVATQGMSLDWTPGSWVIQEPQCTGPDGFSTLIQAAIKNQLANNDALKQFLTPLIEKNITEQINSALAGFKNGSLLATNNQLIDYQSQSTEVVPDIGLLVHFQVNLDPDDTTALPAESKLTLADLQQVGNEPALIIPKSATASILKSKKLFPQVKTSLNSISAFASLMKSRFLQFFVWPELMHFKKTAAFNMMTTLNPTAVEQQKVTFLGGNKFQLQAAVSSWVTAERDNQNINFAYLSTQVNSEITYSVANGALVFNTTKSKLSTKSQYMPEYIARYKPRTGIPSSIINKAMSKVVSQQAIQWQAPDLNLGEGVVMRISSVKDIAGTQNIILGFLPKP